MTYKNLVVMVVDEMTTMRKIIRMILKDLQFQEILEAENGADALNLLKTNKVDLLISDWNMQAMNGLELLKRVRADERLEDIPFLMVSDKPKKEDVIEAIEAKVSNILIKPFSPAAFAEKLADIFPES